MVLVGFIIMYIDFPLGCVSLELKENGSRATALAAAVNIIGLGWELYISFQLVHLYG